MSQDKKLETTEEIKDEKVTDNEVDKETSDVKEVAETVTDSGENKTSEEEKKEEEKDTSEDDKKEEEKDTSEDDKKEENKDTSENVKKEEEKKPSIADGDVLPVYVNPEVEKYKKKKKKKLKVALISVASLILICGIAYFVGVYLHYNVYDEKTTINGINVSKLDVEETKQALINDANLYEIKLVFKNGEEILNVNNLELTASLDVDVQDYMDEQNPFEWIFNINSDYQYSVGYSYQYDREKIKTYLNSLSQMKEENMIASTNAVVEMKNGKVVVTDDVTGTEIDKDMLYEAVFNAIDNGETEVNVDAIGAYVKAEYTTDSSYIQENIKVAEAYLGMKAEYTYSGGSFMITSAELNNMATLEDCKIIIDEEKVAAYVSSISEKFVPTYNESKTISFKTHDDLDVDVVTRTKSWYFNEEAEVADLIGYLERSESFSKEPTYRAGDGANWSNAPIGDTYVELDLTDQMVYVIYDGVIVYETPCVSGNEWGNDTPAGVFRIQSKETNTYLVGPDWNNFVYYWMAFNNSIGMHDANWRATFGGEIYRGNGSHGCVNLPVENAGTVYDLVYIGMPVVAYWQD